MPARLSGTLSRWLFATAVLLSVMSASQANEFSWFTDFAAAKTRAERLNRPILVHFYADWCAPCKKMDRDVLHVPAVVKLLHQSVVPVKLNVSEHEEFSRHYEVESVPTDLFLTPDGRVLGVMNGYRTATDYLARVGAIESQYARQRELYWARTQQTPPTRDVISSLGPELPTLELPAMEDRQSTSTGESFPSAEDAPSGPVLKPRADGTVLVGLKGYCPVTLYRERQWVKGHRDIAVEHQGLTYLLASESKASEFRQHAERYAPQLLGCDPVTYFKEGRAIPGSIRLAVYFENRLYLFASEETRAAFRESPESYGKRRAVLLPEELERVLR